MNGKPAIIMQHPSAPVVFSSRMREFAPIEPMTKEHDALTRSGELTVPPAPQHAAAVLPASGQSAEQLERLDAIEALTLLVALHGLRTVQRLLNMVGTRAGEEV